MRCGAAVRGRAGATRSGMVGIRIVVVIGQVAEKGGEGHSDTAVGFSSRAVLLPAAFLQVQPRDHPPTHLEVDHLVGWSPILMHHLHCDCHSSRVALSETQTHAA